MGTTSTKCWVSPNVNGVLGHTGLFAKCAEKYQHLQKGPFGVGEQRGCRSNERCFSFPCSCPDTLHQYKPTRALCDTAARSGMCLPSLVEFFVTLLVRIIQDCDPDLEDTAQHSQNKTATAVKLPGGQSQAQHPLVSVAGWGCHRKGQEEPAPASAWEATYKTHKNNS